MPDYLVVLLIAVKFKNLIDRLKKIEFFSSDLIQIVTFKNCYNFFQINQDVPKTLQLSRFSFDLQNARLFGSLIYFCQILQFN